MFRRTAFILALAAVLPLSGCNLLRRKKPAVPAQAQAPAMEPAPAAEAPPTEAPKPAPEVPAASESAVQEAAKPPEGTSPTAKKTKPRRSPAPKKPTPPPAQEAPQQTASLSTPDKPSRVVIAEGSVPEGQPAISAVIGHDEAAHHRQTTEQLLESTESNLKGLTRTLTAEEQNMVRQIREYVGQSRTAAAEQDLVRAHNLALKAHLLSDELAKR